MSVKVVFIVIGIIFYLVRYLAKNADAKNTGNTKAPQRNPKPQSSSSQKSIDDIFNEFVKEVEGAKKKDVKTLQSVQKSIAKPRAQKTVSTATANTLNWQEVDKSKLKTKKQLINHDDYHSVSHRVDKEHQIEDIANISSTEGAVFDFDVHEIDWQQAIITKEILDRKFA